MRKKYSISTVIGYINLSRIKKKRGGGEAYSKNRKMQ